MYPGIELRLLRYAVAVAETLSFSQAADRLNTSQPSLSRQILKLEEELGVKLFDRTKRWVELTPAGRGFVQEARKAIAHSERAEAIARQLSHEHRVKHMIGYSACLDLKFLSAVRRMRQPSDTEFVYRSAHYEDLVRSLLAHECEAAMMVLPVRESELIAEPSLREPLAVALPASHSLTKKREFQIEDLAELPVILPTKCFGPAVCEHLLAPLRSACISFSVNDEPTGPLEALHLVAEGFGVTFGQPSVLATAKEGVAVRRLPNVRLVIETGVVFHRDNDSPVLRIFLEAVRRTRDAYVAEHCRDLPISA